VWLVPSFIGGAVAVALVGALLGPMYPITMNHAGRVLPRWLLTGAIGWIAGFGQAGSAILPFITGALASRVGIQSLQPLYVHLNVYTGTHGMLAIDWWR
jgi:fucose permease